MRISAYFGCTDFPCADVRHKRYTLPEVDLDEKST
jgi:hypothetical protein